MSPLSPEQQLDDLRSNLLILNHDFLSLLDKRRALCIKIQEMKTLLGKNSLYDPEREFEVFKKFHQDLMHLSVKEMLSFSLIMEQQAQVFSPGSYPNWSEGVHLLSDQRLQLFEMINPLMLKAKSSELFEKLKLSKDFSFLKDFSFS